MPTPRIDDPDDLRDPYHEAAEVIPIDDPHVAAIPVADRGEPLVDLRELGLPVDPRAMDHRGSAAHVRRGLADRLLMARVTLPRHVDLLVVEGYRPPQLQATYFSRHRERVAAQHPTWSPERVEVATALHVAPPHLAPHCAGAAVDLTLCSPDGVELDLGTPVDATPEDSDNACYTRHGTVVGRAREHRDRLSAALAYAGLVNYGSEWWHWSFGDRYWAFLVGAPAALYGDTRLDA